MSDSKRSLSVEMIEEMFRLKHNSTLERIFSEGVSVKYIQFRHNTIGYPFCLYIGSKYDVPLQQQYDELNTHIVYEDDEEDKHKNDDYELLFGSYIDNTYNSLRLDTKITQLDFKRFMKSVSFNKNFGLLVLTQYSLLHIRSDIIYKYKPTLTTFKFISTVPVISIEELVNWTSMTSLTLENMVNKLWSNLTDLNVKHASTMILLKDSLQTLEANKTRYDTKNISLKVELRKLLASIDAVNREISQNKQLLQVTTDELRCQAISEKNTRLELKLKNLFFQRSELENEINTYHILMDEIVYRSHGCLMQLNELISTISKYV